MNQNFSLKKVLFDAFEAFLDNFKVILIRTFQLWLWEILYIICASIMYVSMIFAFRPSHFLFLTPVVIPIGILLGIYIFLNLELQYNLGIWDCLENKPMRTYHMSEFCWAIVGLGCFGFICIVSASLFLIIPGVYLSIRWSLAHIIFAVERLSVFDSLKKSWNLTKGHGIEIFGLWLIQIIGRFSLFLAIPIQSLIAVSLYKHLQELHPEVK